MTSSPRAPRTRKDPVQRRTEILQTAGRLALEHGLERVTMKSVADTLGVRPGLISHYFATIDLLLCEAFESAASQEREALLPPAERDLEPREQLARFLQRINDPQFLNLGRLWLNARHLSRYRPRLRQIVAEQETITRNALTVVIREGVRTGDFITDDPESACVVILVVIDGLDSYSNDDSAPHPATVDLVFTIAERELGLPQGGLRGSTSPPRTSTPGSPASGSTTAV
ncbi:TetR/AcrR family transcriptional regulator [Streptosporangium sandarakinum]|uniref:TetR/AcrR family transcriptional regulator n=1 Tax=Streptosporangium TaxID=2000 RepID=UPI0031F9C6CD